MYFGREVALSDRSRVEDFSLSKRSYIGPTSMDCEMSFIMANMGKVGPGKGITTAEGVHWEAWEGDHDGRRRGCIGKPRKGIMTDGGGGALGSWKGSGWDTHFKH